MAGGPQGEKPPEPSAGKKSARIRLEELGSASAFTRRRSDNDSGCGSWGVVVVVVVVVAAVA